MCTYHKENEIMCAPTVMVVGVGRVGGGGEEPVGGVIWL